MVKNYKLVLFLLVVLLIAGFGLSFYFYSQLSEIRANPQKAMAEEVEALVAKVGRLMVLPTGEVPQAAVVADPSQLADQPFFAKAEKGDRVLIYPLAQKIILYSVAQDKILDVSPLNVGGFGESGLTP